MIHPMIDKQYLDILSVATAVDPDCLVDKVDVLNLRLCLYGLIVKLDLIDITIASMQLQTGVATCSLKGCSIDMKRSIVASLVTSQSPAHFAGDMMTTLTMIDLKDTTALDTFSQFYEIAMAVCSSSLTLGAAFEYYPEYVKVLQLYHQRIAN
jgi:hypothetical protein